MRASLIGIILLFSLIFAQNSPSSQDNLSLVRNEIPCLLTRECQEKVGPNSQCKDKACVCPVNGQLKECPLDEVVIKQGQARSYSDSFVGVVCENNKTCTDIRHAYCHELDKKCYCLNGYLPAPNNDTCLRIAIKLGANCWENIQCEQYLTNSICFNKTRCECKPKYHEAEGECWKDIEYEATCGDNRECAHMAAFCHETKRICYCAGKTIINPSRTMCREIVGHKDRCFENIQCTHELDNIECIEGSCSCIRNYRFSTRHQKCVKIRLYGDPCEMNDDCYDITDSEKNNSLICGPTKTCKCQVNHLRVDFPNGTLCIKYYGEPSSATGLYPMILILVTVLFFIL